MHIDSKLSEPGRTLSSSKRLFFEQANERYQSWLAVLERIQAASATRPIIGFQRKHEIFRSGLNEWLEAVVRLVLSEVGRHSRIAVCHPSWLGDADPAQWARINVEKFLSEWFRQEVSTQSLVRAFQGGTSLLKSKDDPSSNDRKPAVESWFRMASERRKYCGLSLPNSTKPWQAPVWCAECFSKPWWTRIGRPSYLTVDQTKAVVRSAQSDFAGRFEYVLQDAEDMQRVECARLGSTQIEGVLEQPVSPERSAIAKDFSFSEGYRTVFFGGKSCRLTQQQAVIVRTLHEALETGIPALGAKEIRKKAECGKISDSFRSGDGPKVWKKLVVSVDGCKGMYKLNLPLVKK
jgi:hypothetical protein